MSVQEKHFTVAATLIMHILTFVKAHDLGYVTAPDGGYVMNEENKFIPDVGFISKARLPEIPEREVPIPPDFAVEVVSPTDTAAATHRKAMKYLNYSTQMVRGGSTRF